jgi:MFS transporter, PAT family, beta-lactamase induction signal transducer AmpG
VDGEGQQTYGRRVSEVAELPAPATGRNRFGRSLAALRDRRMAAMALLAFASGLPYGAVLGTLNAWLTQVGIKPAEIGILSLLAIGYAFKYLWAPAFQTPRPFPGLAFLGARRSWLAALTVIIGTLTALLALSDLPVDIGRVAVLALVIGLLSATFDIILDAWRIEVARGDEDKDLMSALFQFGYKSAGFVTGFIALLMAARMGWVAVYVMIAGFSFIALAGAFLAPEPESSRKAPTERDTYFNSLSPAVSRAMVIAVCAGWLIAFGMILNFAFGRLLLGSETTGSAFVTGQGPWIVGLTVLAPALVSAWLVYGQGARVASAPLAIEGETTSDAVTRTLFRAIFDPMMDIVDRLKWGAVLVLLLALTYRFTDAVWGTFAYPFYLGTEGDALGHSLDDVAIASKFFGVIATILGSLIGAILFTLIGRMPVFFIGGVIAAATNLLYADLAAGGAGLDSFLHATGLEGPLVAFANWAASIQPESVLLAPDQGQRMARLMATIFAENIAGGLALVAMTAYLTSVVNPRFAAVQYALLASLTMLIGTLGRPWLGELIEARGYGFVFIATFWLGGIAVILSALEWIRIARGETAAKAEPAA